MRIKTHISCIQKTNGNCEECRSKETRSSLDKLLDGGLKIPNSIYNDWLKNKNPRPFILLITGEPGTGKTTFALELAYRWADKGHYDGLKRRKVALNTFYFSSESCGTILRDSKIDSFGWNKEKFQPYKKNIHTDRNIGWVALFGTELQNDFNMTNFGTFFKSLKDNWGAWMDFQELQDDQNEFVQSIIMQPALVVVDSLNVLNDAMQTKEDAFRKLISEFPSHPLIFAVVLDSLDKGKRQSWEYIADMTLKFERTDLHVGPNQVAYNIGTFEVEKGRWQKHAFGCHQMKILQKNDGEKSPLQHGGICICPSLHHHLSLVDTKGDDEKICCQSTSVLGLDKLIGGGDNRWAGFPEKRCTALVGPRGTMKSHLTYSWLLENAQKTPDEKCLLISLRDDEKAASTRLIKIAKSEISEEFASNLESDKEIIPIAYFKPGYITPGVFLFKLWYYLDKYKPKRVVVNAFEQLETLFPLCAAQPSFVSSIVEMLCDQEITSVVNAVIHRGAFSSETDYGLLPVSDMVLRFEQKEYDSLKNLLELLPGLDQQLFKETRIQRECLRQKTTKIKKRKFLSKSSVETVIEINRVPSGNACGSKGILYLDKDKKLDFMPLS